MNGTRRIYLDHAATTPVEPAVVEAMCAHLSGGDFNPSSLHAEGRRARAALDAARVRVAEILGARPREIVFTSGGSEADNLALFGVARARRAAGRHIVTSVIEHEAILRAAELLRDDGFEITLVGVDGEGRVTSEAFAAALRPDTVLASIMLANNEIGTCNDIAQLADIAHARGIVFHTDAVQAPGGAVLDVGQLGVDAMSLSAHKFYGPKGVGLLYVREGTPLAPLIAGGDQEAGRRGGTENVAAVIGLGTALERATAETAAFALEAARLRDRLENGIESAIPGVLFNGSRAQRLPNLASISFPGVNAHILMARLDLEGVAVSTGSACAAGAAKPSHTIAALGGPPWASRSTIRFSLGRRTTDEDVECVLGMLPGVVAAVTEMDLLEVGRE